jgi:hypothetical protein
MKNTYGSCQLTGFAIGKSGWWRLVEKPNENANECQSVAFGSIPGEDCEQFDLSMSSIDSQETKIQWCLTQQA